MLDIDPQKPMHTQVGGKYSNDDSTVFLVKRRLQESGFTVTYPLADGIIAERDGIAFAFDPSTHIFKDVEADYYASISSCAFHTVANVYHESAYMGSSASLEAAYAMCFGRPVMSIAPLQPNDNVDKVIRDIVETRSGMVHVVPELILDDAEALKSRIQSAVAERIDYSMTADEYYAVVEAVRGLLNSL